MLKDSSGVYEPCFSIIIPCFNYAQFLLEALDSIVIQSVDDLEVIIVNDGSTDDTEAVVKSFMRAHPSFPARLIQQENQGTAAARNRGIQHARGRYLIFLDADDSFNPHALTYLMIEIARQPQADCLIANYTVDLGHGKQCLRENPTLSGLAVGRLKQYLEKKLALANGAVAVKRAVFSMIEFEPSFMQMEDIPLFVYLLTATNCQAIHLNLITVRKHADSMRHQLRMSEADINRLCSHIFDSPLLPEACRHYRQLFLAKRYLSLFRNRYRHGLKIEAIAYYHQSLRLSMRSSLRLKYFTKYLACVYFLLFGR